jgi:outer membrane protein TolC
LLAALLGVLAGGCATYAPLPLGNGRGLDRAGQLSVSAASMPVPALATHRFDPSDGLDVTEVAMLAVANSPTLKVKRDDVGIARAQAFAAGLLPDPQLSLGRDFPTSSGSGLTSAFDIGLSEDVGALLTRSSRVGAARSEARRVNLDLLWAEWQTIARARLLFDEVTSLRAQHAQLETEHAALVPVGRYVNDALRAGNLTYDSASAGLNAVADVERQLAADTIALHRAESELRVLLGLAPQAPLQLVGAPYQVAPADLQVRQAMASLPRRRPDLLALQAGYQAQEQHLRTAILAQFPALGIGFTRARDTGAVYTSGFTIGLTLPLFDRNRGNIAIQKATRQQLKDDYAARMLATRNDIERLQADLRVLRQQRATQVAHARQLDGARADAEQAWQAGLLDWPTYLAIRGNALSADLARASVREEQARQAIALQTLLGTTAIKPIPAQASTP